MEGLRRLKKGLAYLLSMALVIGGFYTNSLRANAEGETSVSQIWATFQEGSEPSDYEIAIDQPTDKGLYAKVINGGTYTEQHEADKELLLFVNDAQVTSTVRDQNSLFFVRLAGNSSLKASNFTVSSSMDVFPAFGKEVTAQNLVSFFESTYYTGEPDGQGGWNPSKPYSYEFTAFSTDWSGFTWMKKLTVDEGATLKLIESKNNKNEAVPAAIEVTDAVINGTVSLSATTTEEPNAFVVLDGGSLTVSNSGKLQGSTNSYLEIRKGATVSGISLYDTDGIAEFSDFPNTESFHWEEDKWVRNNPGSGGGSNLEKNKYRVFYDNRGGESNASVLVNGANVDSNATQDFISGRDLVFQLNPPADRAGKTPVVAIYVNSNGVDTVYRTNPGSGENPITLTDNNSKFTFTPTTDDPFEVFIDWSEYDAFNGTEEKPIIVEVECEAIQNCPVKIAGVDSSDQMIDGNRMKVRVASATEPITLNWDGDDPREIKVDGGSSYNNFTNKSQEIALPTTNENNTFYRVVVDYNAQGGSEGGNPGGEGGNGGEGGQNNPQSPDLVKASKGEIVINVSGPAEGGVLSYRIGDQIGYTEVQPNELPLKLDGSKLVQDVVVQIGFITSGGYQFDNGQGNTIQIDDGTPTNIDLDSLSKRTYEVTYDPEKAITVDIKTMESQPQGGQFDGTAYLFWEGDNKQICKYKFDKLSTSHKEGEGENVIDVYDVNFVKASDIKDAATGDVFSITKKFEFVYSNKVDDSRTQHLFDGQLSENDKHAITMDPTNNTKGQKSVTWTPDRAFRITFYEEGYQGICLVTSGMSYPEAPFNETVFGIKDKDIGGTTPENPAILPVYGLEQSLTVTAGANSKPIKEITPLDVPNGAITVSKVETGVFNLAFHSNFYDKVVYQVTDENDKVYYVRIIRETLQAHDNFGPGTPESDMKITANFFFPVSNSYGEYQMVASLWVQDEKGQNVIKEVKVVQPGIVENMDGASTGLYEVTIGATLKQSSYIVPVDNSIVAVSFNILKSGEMNSDTFSGAVSGSGSGAYYDIERREFIYDLAM